MYVYLKLLRNITIKRAIKLISKQKNIHFKELEDIFLPVTKNFISQGILI